MSLHVRSTLHVIGLILFLSSISLLFPIVTALIYQESGSLQAFLLTFLSWLTVGFFLYFAFKSSFHPKKLRHREACAIVTFSWILIAGFGALPYILTGSFPADGPWGWFQLLTNAYFESMSGFTTTGASVLTHIEGLPKSVLLWRSETQWLGGMGIILLAVAILPILGIGGFQLFKSEAPGISVEKISPRISETAKTLWLVYLLLTVLEIIFLMFGKMSFYDALCHSFSTLATGGFSPRNLSIEHYHSVYIDLVVTVFMILAGINFVHLYRLMLGKVNQVWGDIELQVYLLIIAAATLFIGLNTFGAGIYDSMATALRYSVFQVSSILTATGFSSANWEEWPVFSQVLLLFLMGIGGMAGSTAGGTKVIRLVILLKCAYQDLYRLVHPRAVTSIKINGQPVNPILVRNVMAFFALYVLIIISATFILTALNVDMVTALSAVMTSYSNVGPGLNLVGAAHNFYYLPDLGKWVLMVCMLVGRLEIYTALVLIVPHFWIK